MNANLLIKELWKALENVGENRTMETLVALNNGIEVNGTQVITFTNPEKIITNKICQHYNISREQLCNGRERSITIPRIACVYLLNKYALYDILDLAVFFKKDPRTIRKMLKDIKTFDNKINYQREALSFILEIENQLNKKH